MADALVTASASASSPPLLDRRTVISTGDVDQLVEAGTRLFSPHRLGFRGERARLAAAPVGDGTLICLQYGGDSAVATTEQLGYYAVHLPVSGRGTVTFAGEQAGIRPGVGVVFNPGDQPAMRWSPDTCLLAMRIPTTTMTTHLARMAGRPVDRPLVFRRHSAAGLSGWGLALRTVAEMVERHRGDELAPAFASSLFEMFLTSLVTAQPHSWTVRLLDDVPAPGSAVARAIDVVRSAPETPWTLAQLAYHAGVGGRALQAAFQREHGMSPMAYVREARLELARRRLLADDIAETSIAEVSAAAGFTHQGRFASAYRAKYGISPSDARRSIRRR